MAGGAELRNGSAFAYELIVGCRGIDVNDSRRRISFLCKLDSFILNHYHSWITDNGHEESWRDVRWHPNFDTATIPLPTPTPMPIKPQLITNTPSKALQKNELWYQKKIKELKMQSAEKVTSKIQSPLLDKINPSVLANIRSEFTEKQIKAELKISKAPFPMLLFPIYNTLSHSMHIYIYIETNTL